MLRGTRRTLLCDPEFEGIDGRVQAYHARPGVRRRPTPLQRPLHRLRVDAANLLDRQFEAAAPNQRWVGDTTEFVIGGSGKLYFAAILDLFSRFIVGWAVSAVNNRHLTIKALQMALKRRYPDAGLLHHSDQGCTYASEDYQDVLDTHGGVSLSLLKFEAAAPCWS